MTKPFPFFRLPRELRDRVYAEVGGVHMNCRYEIDGPASEQTPGNDDASTVAPPTMPLLVTTQDKPTSNMMLVSHAFKTEYEKELRRHAAVRVDKLQGVMVDQNLPLLVKGGRAYRGFFSMQNLEVQYFEAFPYTNSRLRDYEQIIRTLAPLMDDLKTIECSFFLFVPAIWSDADSARPEVLQTILDRDGPLWTGQVTPIRIQDRIVIRSPQFCVNTPFLPTSAELERDPSFFNFLADETIKDFLEHFFGNAILFHATPSSIEGSFWGLDLVSPTRIVIDFDRVVEYAAQRFRAAMDMQEEYYEIYD